MRSVNSLGITMYGSDDWLKKLNNAIESSHRPSGPWDQDRWCHYPLAWFSEKELRDMESYLSVNREHDWVSTGVASTGENMTPLGHYAPTPTGDGRASTTSGEDEMGEWNITHQTHSHTLHQKTVGYFKINRLWCHSTISDGRFATEEEIENAINERGQQG